MPSPLICTGLGFPPRDTWNKDFGPAPELPKWMKGGLYGDAQKLHSKPSAPARLLIILNGKSGVTWVSTAVGTVPPYELRDDNAAVALIWQRVAYDYKQFNVDVTTDDDPLDTRPAAIMFVGDTSYTWFSGGGAGTSIVGGFRVGYLNQGYNYGFCFALDLGNNPKYVADVCSHEAGHLFGLKHQALWDGETLISNYRTDGPIMGSPYAVAHPYWTIGKTPDGINQNDVQGISSPANEFGFDPDALGEDGFMSATNVFENGLLSLIFENQNYANVGDATGLRGSSTAGVFYVSLHTTSPGEAGSQNSTEAAYGAYARQSVARSTSGWTVASGVCDNDNPITFPQASSGSETEQAFGIGSDATGTGNLFLWGALGANLAVSTGITPSFAAGALDITLD